MSRELLATLDLDVERLLFAGAQVAQGDGDLAAHQGQLTSLAARAPALVRIVEQVEQVRAAAGRAAAEELLNLSALMIQVRRAQATPKAPLEDLAPLPGAVPLESPLSPAELAALLEVLVGNDEFIDRRQLLTDAVERGGARDLRLLPFCLPALGDPEIAKVVERKLLPELGEAIAPELKASLDLGGGEADVRKLRALAVIRKTGAKPLLLEALEKGFADLRAAALVALAEIDPSEAEPLALKRLASESADEVRAAALEALGSCPTDRALDALTACTASEIPLLRQEAHRALARSSHPRATERLLAQLTPGLRALAPLEPSEAGTPHEEEAAQRAKARHRDDVRYLRFLVELLGRRRDAQAAQALLDLLRDHAFDEVREATAGALVESGAEEAYDAIVSCLAGGRLKGTFIWEFVGAKSGRAFELAVRMAASRPQPRLAPALAQILTYRPDPRVPPLLIALLETIEQGWGRVEVLKAIRRIGDGSLAEPLKAWLSRQTRLEPDLLRELEQLLPYLRERAAGGAG